jgi:hypothetical protein
MGINNHELELLSKHLVNDQIALVLEVESESLETLKDFETSLQGQFGATVVHEKEKLASREPETTQPVNTLPSPSQRHANASQCGPRA